MLGKLPSDPLRKLVHDRLKLLPHYENLDMAAELKGGKNVRRADHAFCNRSVIIEQKEFLPSPAHVRKGEQLERSLDGLTKIYGQSEFFPEKDKQALRRLAAKFLDNIKDKIHEANEQLLSTKNALEVPGAIGVTIINFDRVPGITPQTFGWRTESALDLVQNGELKYKDTDIVICVCRLTRHFTMTGGNLFAVASVVRMNQFERNLKYARQIRALFMEPGVRHYPNMTRLAADIALRQITPSVFSAFDEDET